MTGDKRKSTINRFLNGTRDFFVAVIAIWSCIQKFREFSKKLCKIRFEIC